MEIVNTVLPKPKTPVTSSLLEAKKKRTKGKFILFNILLLVKRIISSILEKISLLDDLNIPFVCLYLRNNQGFEGATYSAAEILQSEKFSELRQEFINMNRKTLDDEHEGTLKGNVINYILIEIES